jgi:cysteinyl-tRNA synthetase
MTTLRLYNTLTRQKEDFAPLDPKNVRLYVCGPTVYDYAHIGNARPVIVFDVLFRLLRHVYGADHVTYVRNITDIDDKINARAAEVAAAKGVSVEAARAEITAVTAKQYLDDVTALGCLPPTHTPRATEHVPEMIAMIERLIATHHAYGARDENGENTHILFDVSSKPGYGKLARRSLDEMIAGARVEVSPFKKNPMDFVLWKPSDEHTPGWESRFGRGRPGWHIECSAMAAKYLGETFDIHGGGIDLMFPHHENEIAQSESAHHDHPLAKVWMHNGFLQVEGEKMSKSLGNFVTIKELTDEFPNGALRLAMLRTHYRQPINWMRSEVEDAWSLLREWILIAFYSLPIEEIRIHRLRGELRPSDEFLSALSDDLNTPEAIAVLHSLFERRADSQNLLSWFASCELLGILDETTYGSYLTGVAGRNLGPSLSAELHETKERLGVAVINRSAESRRRIEDELLKKGVRANIAVDGFMVFERLDVASQDEISDLIDARTAARKARNFAESDRIRDELLAKGIVLKDGPNGTTWEVKR